MKMQINEQEFSKRIWSLRDKLFDTVIRENRDIAMAALGSCLTIVCMRSQEDATKDIDRCIETLETCKVKIKKFREESDVENEMMTWNN